MNRRKFLLSSAAIAAIGLPLGYVVLKTEQTGAGSETLTLTYNAEENPDEKSLLAQLIQAQLKLDGIVVNLQPLSSVEYNDRIGKHEFQAALTLWYLDYNSPEGYLTDFYSKAGYRLSGYDNPAYDKAYLSGLFATNADVAQRGFQEAASIVDRDVVWLPLYSNNDLFLLKPGTEGFRSNAFQYYDYRGVTKPNLHVATDIEVQTLDPKLAYDLASKHLVTQSYEGLVALDSRNQLVPALADSWQVSADGQELKFSIRPNVPFHGTLAGKSPRFVTAADVKASFERTAASTSPYAYIFDHVLGIDEFRAKRASAIVGLEARGNLDFLIKLSRPVPAMLQWLLAPAASVMPYDLPKDYDFRTGSKGTGPFALQEWNGTKAVFKGNDAYWGNLAGSQSMANRSLTISVIKDPSVQLLAFNRGELDILNIPLALYGAILDKSGKLQAQWSNNELRVVALGNLKFVAFNLSPSGSGPDKALRERIGAVINRNEMVDRLFRGQARVATSVLPSDVFAKVL